MPKSKIIQAFVAVWCAVCLSYVGVRTAVAGFWDSSVSTPEDVGEAPDAAESADQDEMEEWDDPTEQDELEEWDDPTKQDEPTKGTEPGEHTATGSTEQSEPVTQVEPMTRAEPGDSSTNSDAMEWEEQGEAEYQDVEQEEQIADVPSLEEYLSGFTCGSCRRNCSLDNPRCHNGSRLAQAKAEEYHNIYG